MDKTVKVVVKITARPDAASAMRAVVLALAQASRKEAGCVSYDVLQNTAEPHVFVWSRNGRAQPISTRTIRRRTSMTPS